MRSHQERAALLSSLLLLSSLGCAQAVDDPPGPLERVVHEGSPPKGDDPQAPSGPTAPVDTPQAQGCAQHQALFDETAQLMRAELLAHGVPGGSLAIVCDGQLAYAAGIGVKRQGSNEPVTDQTLFQLASVTKMLTAATALKLVDSGELDMQVPIGQQLPSLGGSSFAPLTMHQLLSHTAGFPTEFGSHMIGLGEVVQANLQLPMWAPPGDVFNYSNPGYALAGYVLEQLSGVPFAELVEQRLFSGTNGATMQVSQVLQRDHAMGHSGQAAASQVIAPDGSYYDQPSYGPMGGAWGSARDLALWAQAEFFGQQAAAGSALLQPHTRAGGAPGVSYGYGFYVDEGVSPRVVSHGGSTPGFLTHFEMVPDKGLAVAVVVNGDWYYPRPIGDHLMAGLVEFQPEPLPPAPTAPASWSDYVGSYLDEHEFGRIEVTIEGDKLMAHFVDRGFANQLSPYYGDSYDVDYPGQGTIEFNFWRDSDGGPVGYVVSLWGVAKRLP